MRLISLTCSNTEIVAALGCGDLLVGVDDYSDSPEAVLRGLPRVGPDLGIDVEAVAALEPDLVLASLTVPGHEKVVAALEAAGLPFIAPAPERLEDVYRDIRDIARRLEPTGRGTVERGEAVVAAMQRRIRPGSADSGSRTDRPSILVQWWPKPVIAPGRRSWVTDLIEAAGGVNPLGAEPVLSRPIPFEEIRDLDPDAVVISWCGVEPAKYRPEVVRDNPVYAGLDFIERDRVFTIPEAFLGRPSPRLVDGYEALERVVDRVLAGS